MSVMVFVYESSDEIYTFSSGSSPAVLSSKDILPVKMEKCVNIASQNSRNPGRPCGSECFRGK